MQFVDFFLDRFFNTNITSCVLAGGFRSLCTFAALYVSVHACPHLTLRPLVSYYMRIGADGCFNAALLGSICPLNFNGNFASSSGPLIPVPVFVSCTWYNGFHLQNSLYVSVILFFLHLLSCVGPPVRLSPLGTPVSRWFPVSVVIFIFVYRDFLAHESHPSSWLGFLLCWFYQFFLRLTVMFLRRLVSVLIFRWDPFLCLFAILIMYHFLFYFRLFLYFLPFDTNKIGQN